MTEEEILDLIYSTPIDPETSDIEGDDDALEEFDSTTSCAPQQDDSFDFLNSLNNGSVSNHHDNTENVFLPQNQLQDTSYSNGGSNINPVQIEEESDSEDWDYDVTEFEGLCSSVHEMLPKPTYEFSKTDAELVYLEQFLDEEILSKICYETNLYAFQNKSKNWKDITVSELKAFLGVNIIMGIHVLPAACNYWSSDPILNVHSVSNVMTVSRYKKIVENLHCNDNSKFPSKNHPQYDRLYKLRPIITMLNAKCQKCYVPSHTLSVDESMVPFKGRTTLKQYMPLKPVKRGYKIWCLADSATGYITNLQVYTGKTAVSVGNFTNFQMCERVVLDLCEPYFSTNRLVAFDNFFTTYKLMKTLRKNGLYSCGTVRGNRKGLPSILSDTKIKLNRGEFTFLVKSCVAAVKWQDNKAVSLLSTLHNPKDVVFIQRKQKDGSRIDISCPEVVRTYNNIMGGVDRFDQLRERYAIGRRSVKWWHRLFYFFIDLAVINSFQLKKLVCGKTDQLSFRLRLARQLIGSFSSRIKRGPVPVFMPAKRGVTGVPDEVRCTNVGRHIPKSSETRRRCRYCSTKREDKRTKIICSSCNVPLCVTPCFSKFHEK